ncbi:MAG: hypothetical protein V1769_06105 [Thermoplasmatota archaeon]
MEGRMYECDTCGRKTTTYDGSIPKCCGKPMTRILPLDVCTQPHSAEYSGPFEEDEPCDDGRAG